MKRHKSEERILSKEFEVILLCIPLNMLGGNFVHVRNLCEGFRDEGIRVTLLTSLVGSNRDIERAKSLLKECTDNLINISRRSSLGRIISTAKRLRMLLAERGQVVVHSMKVQSDLCSSLIAKGVPVVSTLEGDLLRAEDSKFKKAIVNCIYGIASVSISQICSIGSRTAADYSKKFPQLQTKIKTVNSGISKDLIKGLFGLIPPILSTEVKLGFVANLSKMKGIEDAIETHRMLCQNGIDSSLFVFGEGDLTEYVERKALEDNKIHYLGYVEDKANVFDSFDVLLFPSYQEGLPWTILEAMAAGRIVISRDVGSVTDVVINGKNGFLVPYNASFSEEAVLLINRLKCCRSTVDSISKEAKMTITDHFTLKREISQYLEVYSKVVFDK